MIKIAEEKKSAMALIKALKGGNEKEMQKAWEDFHSSIVETIKADYEDVMQTQDKDILSRRGFRVLTNAEQKFYNNFIEGAKSSNPNKSPCLKFLFIACFISAKINTGLPFTSSRIR